MKKIGIIISFMLIMKLIVAQPAFFYHNQQIKLWYLESKEIPIQNDIQKVISGTEIKSLLDKNNVKQDSIFPYFHFIDFNQDGLYDLLFNGKIGAKNHVIIYKKKVNGEYTLVLNQMGEILQTNAPNQSNPLSLTIWNYSCCGYKVSTLVKWMCTIKNNVSYFEVQEQSLIYRNTVLPDVGNNLIPLQHFTIKNEVAKLRLAPRLDDESLIEGVNTWRGNHVSYHPLGASGVVYYLFKDKEGITWYFVKINTGNDFPTKSDRFKVSNEIEDCEAYSYYGWIHGDNLFFVKP